ncbi:helicase-exonuclease AddAB subunit AddB [Fervidibacillus halotolerans]|uniref:ATP-dependent helicase/deoxyribonuclease subunit B n=1 Tax=Fervidibacillus halotolerans TaxID=2980027 RepID=A0A9E8RZC9_9BACI|nr:helicase-exonuclease AddAB subunit AddB [Fervidibacillus halotolerans]WAA13034.1 helicase-exonuclease AddAB subunit AddB [Fervidibacillus halotolerans]
MSLRFVIGRTGSGKTSFLMKEIIDQLQTDPIGEPIYYIVPEQMTFLSEYKLVTHPKIKGMFRVQVYSFTRLAWRILQETGGISRVHLNSTGLNMLIRRIINEKKGDFRIFKRTSDQLGFIDQMEKTISELKRYCITENELSEHSNRLELGTELKDKLHDMEIIYRHFERAIQDKYVGNEDYLTLLAENIGKSSSLKHATIYIDGFHSFTPQEFAVIEQLMKVAKRVTVALTVDAPYRRSVPDHLELFRMTGSTYASLFEIAELNEIPIEKDIVLKEVKRFSSPSLQHLEQFFNRLPTPSFNGKGDISIVSGANPRAEIEGVARKIISYVRDKQFQFKDIAIFVRNGQTYYELFETVFSNFDIPFYIDQKRSMLNHPLIEFIRSTLEIITGNWRYDPVFRAIKTDLLIPMDEPIDQWREKMDRLENYCLAFGIQGEKWTRKERWRYKKYRGLDGDIPQTDEELALEKELNESRAQVSTPIIRLANRLKKAKIGKEFCHALFLYLEELEIPAKLEKMKLEAERQGNLTLGRQHEQAWNSVIDLLDQYVEILGEDQTDVKQFASVIESGLESLTFSIVPPALDQVIIADMELSRLSDVKIAFVVGLNDGILPKKYEDESIFSDEDRQMLQALGMNLAPSTKERLADEEFIAYKAFTVASDYLILTYPLADSEGKALVPSPYLKRLKDMFPDQEELFFGNEPNDVSQEEQLEYLVNWNEAITYVTYQLQLLKKNYPIEPIWWDGYNLLINSEKKQDAMNVFSSLFYKNQPMPLTERTAKELYGEKLQGSISRMERFNSCPFSHYLSYGLKLKEREVFRLEAPDIGELFHGALKVIGERINDSNLSWASLTQVQIQRLVREAVERLAPKLQNEILHSTNRYQYLKRKLEKVIWRATNVLSEQAKASGFSPIGMEVSFGPKGKFPPVRFRLKNGTTMELVGRIDRIDKGENERGVFLRVIDYKSSSRDINLAEVYYGLSLQMLTYLDIILRYSKQLIGQEADPAGVLYFHIHNPTIKVNKPLTFEEIEEEIFKRFRMDGLMLADADVIRLMDQTLESGTSKIVAAGLKKDGTLRSSSKVASKQDFDILRKFIHHTFQKTGNDIVEGRVDLSPYKMKDKTPCRFCPYKSVCQFDPTMEENQYRILSPLDGEEALELVKGVVRS